MRSRSHKEGGTTKIFPYRNSVRPQDQKEKPKPLCRITASCFPEHLSKIPMGSFYLPICLGIILIPLIPYFFSNQATAARYTLALSVTIFRIHPQQHIISSNNHIPTDRAVSSLNGRPSAHEVIPHLP